MNGAWRRIPFAVALAVTTDLLLTPIHEPPGPPGSDKVVHALLFATLAVLGRVARLPARGLFVGLVCYAVLTEVLQATLPIHRDGNVYDALADVTGALLGLLAVRVSARAASAPGPRSPR